VIDHKDLILGFITAIGTGFLAWNISQTVSGAVLAIKSLVDILKLASAGQLELNAAMKANIIGIVVTAVSMLVSAFIYLWNNCEGFRNFFINMWEGIKSFFSGIVDWFGHALLNIGAIFSSAWEGIKGIWSGAKDFFSGVRGGINQAFENIGTWFSEKFTAAKKAAQDAWTGAKEHFATVKEGITTAFSTVDSFMSTKFGSAWTAVKNAFAPFVGYFQQLWNTVKGIFSVVKSVLSGNFSDAWASIKGIFSGWSSYFSGLWNNVKNTFASAGSWFGDIFRNAWSAITNAFSGVTSFFSGIWAKIKGAFSGALSGMASIGKDIIRGLWNGINDMVGWIGEKIQSFGENVLSGIKRFFGIKSPSTVMRDQVGRDLVRGVGVGIEENADEAIDPMDDLVSEMTGVNIDRNISNTFRGTAVNEFSGLSERLDAVVEYLSKYLPGLADNASQGIYLDGDTLVGTLGGRIDAELARQYVKKGRGQ
jgi:phage-related protein